MGLAVRALIVGWLLGVLTPLVLGLGMSPTA